MISTEAEARERWCPFSREIYWAAGATMPVPGNRGLATARENRCLGSECELWAWVGYDSRTPPERIGGCGVGANLGLALP